LGFEAWSLQLAGLKLITYRKEAAELAEPGQHEMVPPMTVMLACASKLLSFLMPGGIALLLESPEASRNNTGL
jgi:hypothetical protein